MKTTTLLSIFVFAANCVHAQLSTAPTPTWKVTLKVVDDAGNPVAGAKATIGNVATNQVTGLTDTNGIFIASHHDKSYGLGFIVTKEGYYRTWQTYDIGWAYQYKEHPERWNPTIDIILKRMIKPIPMYAKEVRTHVPDLDKPVGYDLMVGDWITPYGRGIQADFLFAAHFETNNDESDFTLTVSFPNQMDGIQEFNVPKYYLNGQGSTLRSAEEAPIDGYQPRWIQTDGRKSGQPVKTNRDLNRNYYFRVRTKVDDRGNIVSAHYGKIYGDFMQFRYYLNPTPNDRNVEFDPKRNLVRDLKPLEGISEP